MQRSESLDSSCDIPLEEIGKILGSSTSDDESVPLATPGRKLGDEYPRISVWCIMAYAVPAMPIQAFFTMFTVYLIPYLITELGLTAFQVSLVLLASPLSGLTASPVFGILSDRSGRRFIFYTAGAATMAVCQLVLAWCRNLVGGNLAGSRWLSTVAVYVGCVSVRACITGWRVLSIDGVPPQQQPVFNLASGLMSAAGAIGTLAAGLVNPSFQLVAAICAAGTVLSVVPLWAVRPAARHRPAVQEGGDRLDASILSIPRALWITGRSLPPQIRHAVTRGQGSETVPPDDITRASVRVLLIAQIGALLLQTALARSWDPSVASAGPVRRFMDEDMVALRRIWSLAFMALGVSTLGAILFRTSFMAASICAASIMSMSPLSGWVPFTIISYEASVVQRERGGAPRQASSGTFISLHEMAITTGQGLAVMANSIISFGLDHVEMTGKNPTAFLFPPAVAAAFVAVVIC
ncbi:sucrose transporter [Colletotrichum cereale]|nr:sucrose transporter [Colletotrichum cereale]